MYTIGVLNSKGGVGKTMISTLLAVRAAKEFARVAIVDLDPQRGSVRWWGHRGKPQNPEVMVGESEAAEAVEKLHLAGYDVVIFDGAPGSLEATEDAIKVCDLVVIPLKAADQDLGSTEYVVSACRHAGKKILLVINEVDPNSSEKRPDRRAEEVRQILEGAGLTVVTPLMKRRVGYTDAMNTGKAVIELSGQDAAKEEVDALFVAVMGKLRETAAPARKGSRRSGS
jgi:chromosome partitioning protein